MIMTQRFEKAYNSLVKAYFENTLAKGICRACAVGNIVADAQGGTVQKVLVKRQIIDWFTGKPTREIDKVEFTCNVNNHFWGAAFSTSGGVQSRTRSKEDADKINSELTKLTGYTLDEMAQIEYAFETNTQLQLSFYHNYSEQDILEDQFKGLSAVVDVMVELDGIENDNNRYNNKFREHPALVNG